MITSNKQSAFNEASGETHHCKRPHRTKHKNFTGKLEWQRISVSSVNNNEDNTMKTTSMSRLPLIITPMTVPEASQHSTVISGRRSAKIVEIDTIIRTSPHQYATHIKHTSCDLSKASKLATMCHQNHHHHHRRRRIDSTKGCCSTLSMAKLIVMTLLAAAAIVTVSGGTEQVAKAEALVGGTGQQAETTSGNNKQHQPQAEAIISSAAAAAATSNQNVIVIKYANVTKDNPLDSLEPDFGASRANEQQLNLYQLYNEPLSVSVIESKFSHSIQLFDVSQNQLSTLSKDLFCPLSNEVRQLNISHNLLENFDCLGLISQAGQLCLSELRILDMSFNLIRHLPATGVATLHNLEVLNLSHNLIESLDELSLSSLFKLTRLDLSFNRIQQLPTRIFHKSSSMRVLRLQSNSLQQNINQILLAGLISLEEINLSFNNLSQINDLAFLEKPNLTRVDLSHNQLNGLRQEALRVTFSNGRSLQQQQQPIYKPRLHHNGNYAGLAQVVYPPTTTTSNNRQQHHSAITTTTEFYLSSNPFNCDCQLEWMRKFNDQQLQPIAAAVRRSVLSSNGRLSSNYHDLNDPMMMMQSDQPAATVIQSSSSPSSEASSSASSSSSSSSSSQNNIISENYQQQQKAPSNQANNNGLLHHQYGRIADLELIKCMPIFRRNAQMRSGHQSNRTQTAALSSGEHHNHNNVAGQHHSMQVHHPNNHLLHQHGGSHNSHHHHTTTTSSSQMIDLLSADSSNFLCRYKSHCFALCHCCEFDACDCEMICPHGCNCYYDLSWQTNIIDCSANNHKVVPERIPMDVSGLYLDGNNIDSLRPSNLIARKSLKTLYLNSSQLQYIANRTFNGLIELQTLYLNDNQLSRLNGYEFEPLAQLKALYLQSNRLDFINNQTFIYLRSLEVLDLSNNRLTSMNLDLFLSIGHHNIRLRQLSIAHNWWSCQCSSIQTFRQILKQKFLLNGGVQISDRNQLRCYYNSTTVGPLILDGGLAIGSLQQQQPVFASFLPNSLQPSSGSAQSNDNRQQQQLSEINQCSESILDPSIESTNFNPPVIQPPATPTISNEFTQPASSSDSIYQPPLGDQQQPSATNQIYQQSIYSNYPSMVSGGVATDILAGRLPGGDVVGNYIESNGQGNGFGASSRSSSSTMPLTSFLLVSILFVCMLVIALSIFVFVRQQQRVRRHHHKKSSAASTTSVSSSASSTAISAGRHHNHLHHHHQKLTPQQQYHTLHHHLIMGDNISNHVAGGSTTGCLPQAHQQHHNNHHQHSASSQSSNIYAALVSPTTGSSTIVTSSATANGTNSLFASQQQQQQNNLHLYSNSSTTASSSSSQHHQNQLSGNQNYRTTAWQSQHQQQQPFLGQQHPHSQCYGQTNGLENPYAINASNLHVPAYKGATQAATGSLYNVGGSGALPSIPLPSSSNCHETLGLGGSSAGDWIKLPKVKQFMSKLVNKSLALGGYRLRDDYATAAVAANMASDKIYDAFLSYDKRDEALVMQHLAAELEYGQPQFRIADRFRDLPLPSSAYMAEAISSVIGCSHRTILVLTENYLTSDWCRFELQAALRESSIDKQHKIIAIILDPKCLLSLNGEMRSLLTTGGNSLYCSTNGPNQQQQLVQLADSTNSSSNNSQQDDLPVHQLIATLTRASGGNQQVSTQATQLATSRITFINYNERKFWQKLKQLMPVARPSAPVALTLTTKN